MSGAYVEVRHNKSLPSKMHGRAKAVVLGDLFEVVAVDEYGDVQVMHADSQTGHARIQRDCLKKGWLVLKERYGNWYQLAGFDRGCSVWKRAEQWAADIGATL